MNAKQQKNHTTAVLELKYATSDRFDDIADLIEAANTRITDNDLKIEQLARLVSENEDRVKSERNGYLVRFDEHTRFVVREIMKLDCGQTEQVASLKRHVDRFVGAPFLRRLWWVLSGRM